MLIIIHPRNSISVFYLTFSFVYSVPCSMRSCSVASTELGNSVSCICRINASRWCATSVVWPENFSSDWKYEQKCGIEWKLEQFLSHSLRSLTTRAPSVSDAIFQSNLLAENRCECRKRNWLTSGVRDHIAHRLSSRRCHRQWELTILCCIHSWCE